MAWRHRQAEQDAVNGLIAASMIVVALYGIWNLVQHYIGG